MSIWSFSLSLSQTGATSNVRSAASPEKDGKTKWSPLCSKGGGAILTTRAVIGQFVLFEGEVQTLNFLLDSDSDQSPF